MVSDKCWPATRTTIRMPNIWVAGRRTRSAQSEPSVGLIHEGPTFTQFTNTCGATCTTSSPARAQTATCSTKEAGKTTDLSRCMLNIVLLKMFLKNWMLAVNGIWTELIQSCIFILPQGWSRQPRFRDPEIGRAHV